jgi:hypothetical protein
MPQKRHKKLEHPTGVLILLVLFVEARVGIEPTHKGFADLSLTTWVPRPKHAILIQKGNRRPAQIAPGRLERETGLEPATLALARRCSTTELLPHGSF